MTPRDRYPNLFRYPLTGMSAQKFVALATGIVAFAVMVVQGFHYATSFQRKPEADSAYVHQVDFRLFQHDLATQRSIDSMAAASDKREVITILKGIDSSMKCVRHLSDYCR